MKLNEAKQIAGSLSHPSKMPCPAWGISQKLCKTGARQARKPGTVCSKCYAARGHYVMSSVRDAHVKRLQGLAHPRWVEAMVMLINEETDTHFRWFDSGDLQSRQHLEQIQAVAGELPHIKFWLPTQEQDIVKHPRFLDNLTVRVTAPMINPTRLPDLPNIASVIEATKREWDELIKTNTRSRWHCPAEGSGPHKCGPCRACWDQDIKHVVYRRK